ncbi:hypothetical protein JCM18897A_18400 [Streptomyces sp. JCM 18897]
MLGDGGEGPELGEGGSLGGAAGAGRGGAVVHGAQGLRPVLRCDEGGVGDPARRCSSLRARVGGAPVTPATSQGSARPFSMRRVTVPGGTQGME